MKRIIPIIMACLMLFSVGIFVGCGGGDNREQLVVATNAAFQPFEYKEGNKFTGIDIEIAKLIADELDMELVIQDMDFDAVVSSVGLNKIDIAMAGLTVTDERKEAVDFTVSYFDASQVIIVKSEDTTFDLCETVEDVEAELTAMSGKKAGFQNGTTGGYYLKGDADFEFDGYSNITSSGYDNGGLAVADLINNNINFVVIDEMPARAIAAKQNGKVKVIDIKLTDEEYAYGVDKNQPQLKASINTILERIMGDDTLDDIVRKYHDDTRKSERVKVDAGSVR